MGQCRTCKNRMDLAIVVPGWLVCVIHGFHPRRRSIGEESSSLEFVGVKRTWGCNVDWHREHGRREKLKEDVIGLVWESMEYRAVAWVGQNRRWRTANHRRSHCSPWVSPLEVVEARHLCEKLAGEEKMRRRIDYREQEEKAGEWMEGGRLRLNKEEEEDWDVKTVLFLLFFSFPFFFL